MSRAIGDFEFKKNAMLGAEQQIVTANPEIRVHQSTEDDEFLILACDGEFSRHPSIHPGPVSSVVPVR